MILVSYNLTIKNKIEELYEISDAIRFNSAWFTPEDLKKSLMLIKKDRFVDIHYCREKSKVYDHNYRDLLKICSEMDIEWVGISNVTKKETVLEARNTINNRKVKICSKIESKLSIDNIEEIVSVSDGIMIDTEDLVADIGYENLKESIEYVENYCKDRIVTFKYSGVIFSINVPNLNKGVVYTYGAFDLLHPGHLRILNKAKSFGDILVVGVVGDKAIKDLKGKDRPIQDLNIRMEIVSNLKCVDKVLEQTGYDPDPNLELIRPSILVKGDDWDHIPGQEWMNKHGGKLIKPEYTKGYSTSQTVKKIKE